MSNLQIHPILLFLIAFETILLCAQAILLLTRPEDIGRKRFFILVLSFFQFTVICSIMPTSSIDLAHYIQTIIAYISSITLAFVYFWYLASELELPQLKIYNIKVLMISLVIAFILAFVVTYTVTQDIHFSRFVFDIIPILAAVYFSAQTVRFLIQKWRKLKAGDNHHGTVIIAASIGIVFIATMPIVDVFDKSFSQRVLNISLVTVSLVSTSYAYMKNHFRQPKLEYQLSLIHI